MKFKRGFTLIELLVVIVIISILISAVIIKLNRGKNGAIDDSQIALVKSWQLSLEDYYSACGTYPGTLEDSENNSGRCVNTLSKFIPSNMARNGLKYYPMTLNTGSNICIAYRIGIDLITEHAFLAVDDDGPRRNPNGFSLCGNGINGHDYSVALFDGNDNTASRIYDLVVGVKY